ncbi:MAG: acetate--CoA ligase [Candidatus Altarchaeaceae archaeon]
MKVEKEVEKETVSESEIAVHWKEEEYIHPPKEFTAQAYIKDESIYERFKEENFPECFNEYANLLTWDRYWKKTLDDSNPPFFKWFVGGKLNACYNCVDRHLEKYKNKAAIIWVPEIEEEEIKILTYQELYVKVNEFASLLKELGLKAGDRVTFHLPMTPELPISMLACARLGIIHSEVFGGFSGKACAERIVDFGSNILVTIDGYYRNGKFIDHKVNADIAVNEAEKLGQKVDKVLIWTRYPNKYSSSSKLVEGRDFIVNDLLKNHRGKIIKTVSMPSEAPLFIMYTSGSTGKPKGCVHSTGGYLSYVAGTSKYILDIHPEDVYWCMADIGWITGHSYIVYGPLSIAATTVIYEGVPTYPDANRLWRIAERLNVNIFHTAPTTIRMLRKLGTDPSKYNYNFKLMVTVGEPIESDVWKWYYEVIGKKKAVIIDTWWQTETGGFLCSTIPGVGKMKPGSTGFGCPGIYPIVLDENGNEIKNPKKAGYICIKNPWPGRMLTIWGNDERLIKTYYEKFCKNKNSKDWHDWIYVTGDAGMLAEDGYFRILGRIDDIINVAGHRLGTKEIESAALAVEEVAEAAVVPRNDEIKGHVPDLYVSLKPGFNESEELRNKILQSIVNLIGPIAKPKNIYFVPDMPKTRSGKIMRRILACISNNIKDIGDITTLVNPDVVEKIREIVREKKEK